MLTPNKIRIDKWLWAVRLFKTRSLAAEACAKNRIRINDQPVKSSRAVKAGEIIAIRNGAFTMQYEVLQLTENRMSAKLMVEFCRDVTPEEELDRIRVHAIKMRMRDNRGAGRPTKKDRRELDDFISF